MFEISPKEPKVLRNLFGSTIEMSLFLFIFYEHKKPLENRLSVTVRFLKIPSISLDIKKKSHCEIFL
jgi:hypothetical protein